MHAWAERGRHAKYVHLQSYQQGLVMSNPLRAAFRAPFDIAGWALYSLTGWQSVPLAHHLPRAVQHLGSLTAVSGAVPLR